MTIYTLGNNATVINAVNTGSSVGSGSGGGTTTPGGIIPSDLEDCVDDLKLDIYGNPAPASTDYQFCSTQLIQNTPGNPIALETVGTYTPTCDETIDITLTGNVTAGNGLFLVYSTQTPDTAPNGTNITTMGTIHYSGSNDRINPTTPSVTHQLSVNADTQYWFVIMAGGSSILEPGACLSFTSNCPVNTGGLIADVSRKVGSYRTTFLASDWMDNGIVYDLIVSGTGIANVDDITVYFSDDTEIEVDNKVLVNGDILLTVNKYPDCRFDGSIKIIGN